MKAIVFATDQSCSNYRLKGVSSPFFNLQGRPMLLYVLVALDQLSEVDEIVILGPVPEIMSVLEAALFTVPFSKKVAVLPQKGQFPEDLLSAINGQSQQVPDPLQVLPSDEVVLCLPGDIPLITTAEIEAFIAASDMSTYDYCIGITEEEALRDFYPEAEKPGIKRPNIQLKDKRFRLNNLHLMQTSKISKVLQEQSKSSPEKGTINTPWTNALPHYMSALFETLLNKTDQAPPSAAFLQDSSIASLEASLSEMSHLKLKFTGRWKGGGALNIDDEQSYQAISERIDDWRKLTADLNQTAEGKKQCPTSGDACKSD